MTDSTSGHPSGNPSRRWLAPLAALLPATLACCDVADLDVGFHVATGRAIDLLGAVPRTNVLSFTNPDHPWILHQWIPAYLLHRVDQALGPPGLVALAAFTVWATFTLLWLALRRRCHGGGLVLWFVLATTAAFPRFLPRPYLFSALGLAAFLWGLTLAPAAGARLRQWRPFLGVTAAAAVLTSCLHAGVVDLWIVAGAWAASAAARGPRRLGLAAAWIAGMAALSAGLLTLVNPYGVRVLLLPFRFSADPWFHAHLAEYRPPPFLPALFPGLWGGVLLGAAGLAASVVRGLRGRTIGADRVFEILAFAAFAALALRHQRMAYSFALVGSFAAAPATGELLDALPAPRLRRAAQGIAATLAVGLAAWSLHLWSAYGSPGFGLAPSHPTRLLAFVRENDLPDPAFVSDAWGGHWLREFYPERRTFVDNRLEAYPFEFYKGVYQSIRYGEPGWEEKLSAHGIRTAALKYTTPGEARFLEGRPSVRQRLLADTGWRLVYWDDHGEVFVRRDAVPPACDACADTRSFDPDRMEGKDTGLVAAEAAEVLAKSGPSVRAYTALVLALRALGDPRADDVLREARARFPGDAELAAL